MLGVPVERDWQDGRSAGSVRSGPSHGSSGVTPAVSPEQVISGFTRRDGSIAFYAQVQELAHEASQILEIGAGRGAWLEDPVWIRRRLHDLRGNDRNVVGIDIDPVVGENPAVDRAARIGPDGKWPVADQEFDLAVADWVIEHVSDPGFFVSELARVLRPGGWFCARTPNAHGYVGIGARMIPKRLHDRVLRWLQPDHDERDKFPTRYKLNSVKSLREAFEPDRWDLVIVPHHPEPTYAGDRPGLTRAILLAERLVPQRFGATMFVFARRRS